MSSAQAFFHKGPTRDCRSELEAEQVARFDHVAVQKLGSQWAHWLVTGELAGGGEIGGLW